MDTYHTDENGKGFVKSSFIFNHNDKDINIELYSKILINDDLEASFSSNIFEFEKIFHNFVDETDEELEYIKINMPDKFNYYLEAVEEKLINFFYEEEYINIEGIIETIKENEFGEN